ncbi:MAG: hypothetical protein K9M45_06420, partial [Kiritimatiellales bacterium]|nr:hypothetical protein [Kiritimatiellales bacterium]
MSVFGKVLFCFAMISAAAASGATYHLDSTAGDDGNDGLSSQTAWKSLEKAGGAALVPGDRLLLRRGSVFDGSLALKVQGSKQKPIIVDAYGESPALPVIDARGHLAGIHLSGCSYLEIANLEIMADAGKVQGDEKARTERFGVFSTTYRQGGSPHIHLRNLFIHNIFATEQLGKLGTKGKNENSNLGMGIKFESGTQGCFTSDILIENCRIERTGHTGIKFSGSGTDPEFYNQNIRVVGNHLKIIGGPGTQPGRVKN